MINLNGEEEAALKLMMSSVNVFLNGEAGTRKSTLVREFIRPKFEPLARAVVDGVGVKETELVTIERLIAK